MFRIKKLLTSKKASLIIACIIIIAFSFTPSQFAISFNFKSTKIITNATELGWHLNKINIEEAWEITKGSKEIIIAVIDSGIDFSHPELTELSWVNNDEIFNNSIDDDLNDYIDDVNGWDFVSHDNTPGPEESDQIHWHATAIAGIIAAPFNGVGIAGVAPNITIMDVRVLDQNNMQGTTTAGLGNAIRYAVENGADVINLSLQYYANSSDYYDDILYAVEQNVVVVSLTGNTWVSAGGGRRIISFPGAYEEVITVGATNYYDQKADYSNYGVWTDIVAPVGDESTGVRSTWMPSSYANVWGTSFACPQVAAVVALIKSLNNSLSVNQIKEILQSTAKDLGDPGRDDYFGFGLLDAYAALQKTLNPETNDGVIPYLYLKIFIPLSTILVIALVITVIFIMKRRLKI